MGFGLGGVPGMDPAGGTRPSTGIGTNTTATPTAGANNQPPQPGQQQQTDYLTQLMSRMVSSSIWVFILLPNIYSCPL